MVFLWSDAWLLQSIICANLHGEGTLDQIIESADGLMVTLINDDELESGLVRLTQGGFIFEHEDKFSTTDKVPEYLMGNNNSCNYDGITLISDFLHAESREMGKDVRDPRNNLKYPGLTAEKIRKANKLYSKRAAKYMWDTAHPHKSDKE